MTGEQTISVGITDVFESAPSLDELAEGETVSLEIGYFKNALNGREKVTLSFHHGPADTVEAVSDTIESHVDGRKFYISDKIPRHERRKSWTIGMLEVNNKGDVVDCYLNPAYFKPSCDVIALGNEIQEKVNGEGNE